MKKTLVMGIVLLLGALSLQSSAEPVASLRGDSAIESDSNAPAMKKYLKDEQPLARDYLQQPPLIPHQIDAYRIDLKFNKCLGCHSWKNYKQHNATKISQTHFESRDGAVMANVSARRYFCTQCHVPQANAQPLVENTFQPVEVMRQ